MLQCVIRHVVTDALEDCSASILWVKQLQSHAKKLGVTQVVREPNGKRGG